MKLPLVALAVALLAGCTATAAGTVTPGASASPGAAASTAPGASTSPAASPAGSTLQPGDFVPTKYTLSIDGKAVQVPAKGFYTITDGKYLGASVGLFKGEKAGMNEVYGPSISIVSATKLFSDPTFAQADATGSVNGLNWVRNLTARTYTADGAAKQTFTYANGLFNVTYAGKMNRGPGSGEFPETIQVDLVVEGIPAK